MNFNIKVPLVAAPPKPKRDMTPQEKLELAALTAAKAKRDTLKNRSLFGKPIAYDELERELGITFRPETKQVPLDHERLMTLLEWYVTKTPERVRAEQEKLRADIEARERRTYSAVDITLPDGLELKPQQKKALGGVLEALYKQNLHGALVPLGTGKGKSFIAAALGLWLQKHHPDQFLDVFCLFPRILIITKRSVVLEFRETLKRLGLQDVGGAIDVWSYQEVSSKKNRAFFEEVEEVVFGQPVKNIRFRLPASEAPRLIILDECQEIKKEKSLRTKYLAAFLSFPSINWVFTSATPAVTLWDTMFMSRAMQLDYSGKALDRETFPEFARMLSGTVPPTKPNAAALERWAAKIGDRLVKPPNDPQKVKAINRVKLFEITDPRNKSMVQNAIDNYIKAVEATGKNVSSKGLVMVQFMVLARAAELATVDQWVADAIALHKQGYAPVLAIRFTETLKEFVLKLSESEYFKSLGYTRDKISLIWGGQPEIKPEDLLTTERAIAVGGLIGRWVEENPDETRMPRADDIGITPDEYRAYKKTIRYQSERLFREMTKDAFAERNEMLRRMNLHNQTQQERFDNVQKFLRGETEWCVYTLSSGGTGISLDHRFAHSRPRWVMSTMTYWSEEFAQALGRCLRLTTLTDTVQEIYIPLRTILADHMAPKLASKLKSIDAIGSSNVDLAAELERAMKKREAAQKLTDEDLKGYESREQVEAEEEDEEED